MRDFSSFPPPHLHSLPPYMDVSEIGVKSIFGIMWLWICIYIHFFLKKIETSLSCSSWDWLLTGSATQLWFQLLFTSTLGIPFAHTLCWSPCFLESVFLFRGLIPYFSRTHPSGTFWEGVGGGKFWNTCWPEKGFILLSYLIDSVARQRLLGWWRVPSKLWRRFSIPFSLLVLSRNPMSFFLSPFCKLSGSFPSCGCSETAQ